MHKIMAMLLAFTVLMAGGMGHARAEEGPWKRQMSLTGGAAAGGRELAMPSAVLSDAAVNRYYVVDAGNNRLLSFDMEGKFLNAFDAGGDLHTPFDMARAENGLLWVAEKGKNSLTSIDLPAKKITRHTLQDGGALVYPDRLQRLGEVFFLLDKGSGAVLVVDQQMQVQQRFVCPGSSSCGFVDFSTGEGSVYALAAGEKAVYRFSRAGALEAKIILAGGTLDFPVSLAAGPAGLLYVLDRHGGSVVVFDQQGQFKYRFLETGYDSGQLYYPIELRFDHKGRLCVVDEGNGRVHVFGR